MVPAPMVEKLARDALLSAVKGTATRGLTVLEVITSAAALSAIFVFAGGLFAYTLITYGNTLVGIWRTESVSQSLILVTLTCVIVGLLVARARPLPVLPFVLGAVLASFVFYFMYHNSFDAPWVSDFRRMWEAAGRMAEQGRFTAHSIIEQRALPLLVPMVYLFGHNATVVPVLNTLCLVAIMLMGYDVLRRVSGHHCAQIFTVLWLAGAETTFALKIPSHDIWGLLFCALILWSLVLVLNAGARVAWRNVLQGVLVGLPVTLLDVQRELGTVALAALGTTTLLLRPNIVGSTGRIRKQLLLILVGAAITFAAGSAVLKRIGVLTSDAHYTYLTNVRTAALAPGYSSGTFRYASTFGKAFLQSQPPEAQAETALSLLLSDLAEQPELRFASILSKMARLSALGSQSNFYQRNLRQSTPRLASAFRSYNIVYSLFIAILFVTVLPSALSRRDNIANLYSLSVLGVLIGGLVTIGEVQPRYVLPVWFFAPLVIAIRLGNLRGQDSQPYIGPLRNLPSAIVVGCGAMIIGVWILHTICDRVYTFADGRIVTDFDITSSGVGAMHSAPKAIGMGQLGFSLWASGTTSVPSSISARRHLCAGDNRTSLRFAYVMPYMNPQAEGQFVLRVHFNGRKLFERRLPDDGQFHDIKIAHAVNRHECGELTFSLAIMRPLPRASWVRATRTEIYFPRLSRQ